MRAVPALAGAALGVAAALALGCSSPQSFIVLVLESSGTAPIAGVAQVTVMVSRGTSQTKTLTYPAADLRIAVDADTSLGTLSVSFSGGESGDITFDVTAADAQGCSLASGTAIVTIKKGAINEGIVPLAPVAQPCGDGGAREAGGGFDGSAFSGCDPVKPGCPTGQTCQVDCTNAKNECTPGGSAAAGSACQSNADCAPGAQCFDYGKLGCATKVCLRFCGGDGDCAPLGSDGGGPGSFCRNPVVCSGDTAYETCTASCDPTAIGSGGRGGCAAGLACLLTGNDRVDCGCPEPTRTKQVGDPCGSAADCAPGLVCNQVAGVATCRAICRCDASAGKCTVANACPAGGTACSLVTGQTLYGVCL